jgi:hypothetical protein
MKKIFFFTVKLKNAYLYINCSYRCHLRHTCAKMTDYEVSFNDIKQNSSWNRLPPHIIKKIIMYCAETSTMLDEFAKHILKSLKNKDLFKYLLRCTVWSNISKEILYNQGREKIIVLRFNVLLRGADFTRAVIALECSLIETSNFIEVNVLCECGDKINKDTVNVSDDSTVKCDCCTQAHFECSECNIYYNNEDKCEIETYFWSELTNNRVCSTCWFETCVDEHDYYLYTADGYRHMEMYSHL